MLIASQQERDPGARAHAADPDHLAREVDEPVLLEQLAPIRLERAAVGAEAVVDPLGETRGELGRHERLGADHQRRIVLDARLAVDPLGHLRERVHAVAGAGLGDRGLGAGHHRLGHLRAIRLERSVDVEARVVHLEVRLAGELGHRRAVAGDRRAHSRRPFERCEAAVPAGDLETRRQALDVPLEWARRGLVEVVDVEHQAALRRAEDAEVREVRITAQLHPQAGRRRRGEIIGHHQRRAPEECERGDHHAAVANRYEVLGPRDRLGLQQRDRVGTAHRWCEVGVLAARDGLALRPPAGDAVLDARVLEDRRSRTGEIGCSR